MGHTRHLSAGSIDEAQVAHFDNWAAAWWDPKGHARWLHRYNPLRVGYIRDAACRHFLRDTEEPDCLRGLRVLDIGCGAGMLCEPLAALGGNVVGADPAERLIEVARGHAQRSGFAIDYRCTTAEALFENGERFDIVVAMEVIEHVADREQFLRLCTDLVRPGGLAVLSTLNRTSKSFWQAIVLGEYVLRLLPRGTHQWDRFVTPQEMQAGLEREGFSVLDISGVTFNLWERALQISSDTTINYILAAGRPPNPSPC